MAPRLSGQTSIFGVIFFVSKSLLEIERQKKHEKFANLTQKPRTHARILINRMWPIALCTIWHCLTSFPSCSGDATSLHHSFTSSLSVRYLKPFLGELPYEKVSDSPKRYHLKQNRFNYSLVDPTRTWEVIGNQAWKRKLNEGVSFNCKFLECTLKDMFKNWVVVVRRWHSS